MKTTLISKNKSATSIDAYSVKKFEVWIDFSEKCIRIGYSHDSFASVGIIHHSGLS